MTTVERIIDILKLEPHPEGGYYTQTYKTDESLPGDYLPERYGGSRSFGTAIYYLLTPDTFSTMHRVKSDELFHFYSGDPVEMLQLFPDGTGKTVIIGSNLEEGMLPQVIVPRGVWQGCRLLPGGEYALMGTTVSPGFEFSDYEEAKRSVLIRHYPAFDHLIIALTR